MRQVFSHEPVMVDEVVALFAPVPAGVVIDATVGRRRARRGVARRPSPPPRARSRPRPRRGGGGDRPSRRIRRPGRGAPGPFRPPATRSPPRSGVGPGLGERRPVRPGRELPAARPARAGLLVPRRRPARHAHGPRRGARPPPTSSTPGPRRELARLFAANGEGRFARRIALAVVAARPVTTTGALADVVRSAPARRRAPPGWPSGSPRLPGPAGRGQRGARGPGRRAPGRIDAARPRRPVRGHRVPLGRGPHREGRVPPGRDRRMHVPPRAPLHLRSRVVGQARVPRDAPARRREDGRGTGGPRAPCCVPSSGARPDGPGHRARARPGRPGLGSGPRPRSSSRAAAPRRSPGSRVGLAGRCAGPAALCGCSSSWPAS